MDQDSHSASSQSKTNSKHSPAITKLVASGLVVVVVAAGGFVGGMHYQKGHGSVTANASSQGRFGPGGNGAGRMNGGFGSVTAVNATSISVKDDRTSSSKTYTIDSSTTITNNGSTAIYSDIKTGDTVMVSTSSSTSTTATRILINPTMGSGGPGGMGTPSNTSTN